MISTSYLARGPPPAPAHFITHIQPQTVIEGHRVVFEARVTGEPEPEVHWFHNGARVYPSPGVQVVVTFNIILHSFILSCIVIYKDN